MKEAQQIEWKETWRDEFLKWISGFANADGGVLHIGRNDKGVVVGVPNAARLMEDIPNAEWTHDGGSAARQRFDPPGEP